MKTDRIFIGTIKKSTYLEDKIKFNNCDIEDEFSSVDCVIYEDYGSKTYKKRHTCIRLMMINILI